MYRIAEMKSKVGTYSYEKVFYVQKRIKFIKWFFWVTVLHNSGYSYFTKIKHAENFIEEIKNGLRRGLYGFSIFKPSQSMYSLSY